MLDDDGSPRPFQDTMSRFGTDEGRAADRRGDGHVDDEVVQRVLAPRFFDVLHIDGEDLIDVPREDHDMPVDAVVTETSVRWIRPAVSPASR